MADIFISYASEDRTRVKPLAKALKNQGWSVFWDRDIPGGKTWDEVIEEELAVAKCVIVVWSEISQSSRWVRAEAEEGLKRKIIVPVLIEDIKVPLLFRPIQAVQLINWQEDSGHPQFEKLISDLSAILGSFPLKAKEAERKRAEEERKRKSEEEEHRAEAEASEPYESKSSEPSRSSNVLKLGVVAGVIVLLIVVTSVFVLVKEWNQKIDQGFKKDPPPSLGLLTVKTNPSDIEIIFINDEISFLLSYSAASGMKIESGKYVLVIFKDGFDTVRKSVEIVEGKETRIDVVLSEICTWPPFIPFVPDVSNIALDQKWKINCYSGEDCIKIGFDTKSKSNWGGLYWHANGNEYGPGVNLYEFLNVEPDVPIILSFYARGAEDGEVVKFQVGGANNEKESVKFPAETSINLTPDWKSYKIDLKDKDLSHVVRGFSCIITKKDNPGKDEVWFFLDDLCYRSADK